MARLAIIGTGIAGLGCAYFLRSKFDCTLFEQNDYAGGHTNTVTVDEDGRTIPIDTGFMVYNEVTYPHLTRLFKELNVRIKPTSMSFSVQHKPSGLEFNGSSFNHLFAQRRNLLNPRFLRMLLQIDRFNREAVKALNDPKFEEMTLKKYVDEKNYGDDFLRFYLVPMSSAVWSTPPELMFEFPAITLIRFFHNHGFLGIQTQHPWLTVEGGARNYVAKMSEFFKGKIRLNQKVKRVFRESDKVKIVTDGGEERYDKVIFACHADQGLSILGDDAANEERRLLGEFKYQTNSALLHTDASVMPETRFAWASWNYRIGHGESSTHYWMNNLQGVSERVNYFVSLNDPGTIHPQKIIKTISYEHPLFSLGTIRAQKELPSLNRVSENQTIYFCGSYFKYGFHEDALTSSLELCRTILKESIWKE